MNEACIRKQHDDNFLNLFHLLFTLILVLGLPAVCDCFFLTHLRWLVQIKSSAGLLRLLLL